MLENLSFLALGNTTLGKSPSAWLRINWDSEMSIPTERLMGVF